MADRFNRIDGTAPLINAAEQKNVNVPKSGFEFSRSIAGPMTVGAIYPIDCFDTMPSERIDINFSGLVESLQPTISKMLNGFDVYIHCYFNRESDLWEGSKNFTTKGRSGKITGSIPRIDPTTLFVDKDSHNHYYNLDTVGSLFDWLGVQPDLGTSESPLYDTTNPRQSYLPFDGGSSVSGIHSTFINAIPFFMYQRLWRDKYAPKNLLQDNKNLFPDNEDHFIIPYSAVRFNKVSYTPDTGSGDFVFIPTSINIGPGSDYYNTLINLTSSPVNNYDIYCDRLRFRQFKGDDFVTSSPFPDLVRGDIPDLSDFLNYPDKLDIQATTAEGNPTTIQLANWGGNTPSVYAPGLSSMASGTYSNPYVTNVLSSVTMKAQVALNAYTIFAQRMGRTNGDYDSMIQAQFGFDPNNQSREARYLGGLHFSLGNDVIRQTSESSQTSALGEEVVRSNGSGTGSLASFTSPDYGYVMTVLSILPNTWYSDGQEPYLSQRYQTDRFFPIFEQLGPEAIKNKELFVSGNATTDDTPFAYVERGYRYKSRRNAVRGLFRAKPTQLLDYSSRVTARRFDTTPVLNNGFTTVCDNTFDYSIFAYPSEYPFVFAGNIEVRRISPMSQYTAPAGFSPATM